MHIKEIIMEGFKSYLTRTVVSGFDPSFNAITGLNGSGKSNVLDAICFVLGITNLSQVRVSKLQELVYKQGQAGTTKATVTIVFDNTDAAQSPVGYEDYDEITITREIAIGGKNKYLINGHKAKTARVTNLFHSVQLNVNNPHFLIMQGRITKVINMKKEETLALVEESAGTRMYEDKRTAALKTMDKKETKVQEINRILREDITPTLERLRKERQEMMTFLSNNADIARLTRLVVAHDYVQAQKMQDKYAADIDALAAELEESKADAAAKERDVEAMKAAVARLTESKNAEMEGVYKQRLEAKEAVAKEMVTVTSKRDNAKLAYDEEVKARDALVSAADDEARKADAMRLQFTQQSQAVEEGEGTLASLAAETDELQRSLTAASAGMTEGDGGDKCTLAEQVMKAQAEENHLKAEVNAAEMRRDDARATMAGMAKDVKAAAAETKDLRRQIASATKELEAAQATLAAVRHDPARQAALAARKEQLEAEVSRLTDDRDALWARLAARLEFNFDVKAVTRKMPGFDPDSVKGVVAQLVNVKDPAAVTALETVAGGRLFNVVVDDAAAGAAILQHGRLKRRVTLIPLDKIAGRTMSDGQLRAAGKAAGDHARPALALVGYPDDVEAAMQHVFGTTFVCDSSDAARAVTFNKTVDRRDRCRSVTLDGDVFDPSGTAEGGAPPRMGSILADVASLAALTAALDDATAQLAAVVGELDASTGAADAHAAAKDAVEMNALKIGLLQKQLGESQYGTLTAKMEALDAKVRAEEDAMAAAKDSLADCGRRRKALAREAANVEATRAKKMKAVEKALAAKKKQLAARQAEVRSLTQATQELELELASTQQECTTMAEQHAAADAAVAAAAARLQDLQAVVDEVQQRLQDAEREEAAQRKQIDECDAELKRLASAMGAANKAIKASELAVKKLTHRRQRLVSDAKNAAALVEQLEAEHGKFIRDEGQFFGRVGTVYDFEQANVKDAASRLAALEKEQAALSKRVNKKAMGMMETAEKEYQDVMNKKRIIENDKKKIVDVIRELDTKKDEALRVTYAKVNKDFGSIFSTLLPGASAKLVPPEGGTVLDGLEVKVAFGGVWKASLTELSGGQRSLLALSLILALLVFKPAPMYILDEVDSALDLSHTQNIGTMLRTHFSKSQFIVVSLKQGMFNNANVVFRTKFVDGLSTIRRTVPAGAAAAAVAAAAAAAAAGAGAGAGAPAGGARRAAIKDKSDDMEENAGAGTGRGKGRKTAAAGRKAPRTTSRRTATKV